MNPRYRFRQFWNRLRKRSIPKDAHIEILAILEPAEVELFYLMPAAEQDHAYRVMEKVRELGSQDRDLLAASLLHDVGKTKVPTSLIERSLAVAISSLFPVVAEKLAQGEAVGFRRPFVVLKMHPQWGAHMAKQAGSSSNTVYFIRRHQEPAEKDAEDPREALLLLLQKADNIS